MARKLSKRTKATEQGALLVDTCTALYIRVSTERQATEGHSLDAQRNELEKYCEANGWTVCPGHVYVDAGVSGKNTDRPAFQQMMQAAQDGRIGRIVATKLDRIARNLKDLLNTVDELKACNCALVVKKEQFDTSTAQGMFVLQMLGAVSELERSMISERVHSGRVENASQGGFNGAPEAYGYSYQDGEFTVNESEAETVRKIFAMFLSGQSLNAIAKALNEAGIPTKRGGQWFAMTVKQTLTNGLYAGVAQWDGEEVEGTRPAIISRDTYEAAHKRLQALRPGKQLESEIERRLQAA
jgi:site-specific DNA recombinase